MKPLGAILAGGRSSRFGSDKALALLAGEPLLAHAARAIRPHVSGIIVCGRVEAADGLPSVADRPRPDLGPLGGLCGALHHAAIHGHDRVLTIGCDMPVVPSALMEELIAAGRPAYVADAPILGIWPSTLAATLEDHLAGEEDRSLRRWAARVEAIGIKPVFKLANVNRPADLARLAAAPGNGSHIL
ncbi:molybdenum cofactor guanylyltransferase [Sphingomonas sp.]|uniref:molybdenum cofactor guanylyltransferase n=1 Tax=Sphingomonas sp. TaxID=28214 RepID=UPI003B3A2175